MNGPSESTSRQAVLVGLMSGTSLDGISAVAVRFEEVGETIRAVLLAHCQRHYSPDERQRLEAALHSGNARDYCTLHADLGEWLGAAANSAIAEAGVPREEIAAIASHGQTVWHEPGHSTWQFGDPSRIAERTGCAVIADFRSRDVAVGGQGAPLVPMADARLFSHPHTWRALQNIGGIGNVTVVPPSTLVNANDFRAVRAFDTGPGVVLIDAVTRVVRPDLPFDVDGALARSGTPNLALVEHLLEAPYFSASPPKTTGREWFTANFITAFLQDCRKAGGKDEDIVATATAFTARSIANQYTRFLPEPVTEVILSGGGAKNPTLVHAITVALESAATWRGDRPLTVTQFDDVYFDSEAKEAVAFALLGYLHLTGRSGNIPSATGAREARVLGTLTVAQ